jgi:transcriptional regulator with XRE-family HTH domain
MMSKALEKIKKIATSEDSSWFNEAKERQQNLGWRKRSFQIASHILIEIRKQKPINGMTQKMLAEKMGVAPQYINKVVKGQENLTLETIAKFEEVLGITLIDINKPKAHIEMESQDFISNKLISSYNEAYNSSKGYFHKILLFKQEEYSNSPFEDDSKIFYFKFNRNELLDKLSSYSTSILKDNSDLKENVFSTNLHDIFNDLWEVKMKELPSNKSNLPFRIIWNSNESKVSDWEKFMNIRYPEKNKYEHEG